MKGIISHYYMLDGKPHIPWIEANVGQFQRCFTLSIMPSGQTVRIDKLNTTINPDAETAGIFILRCYGLWRYGVLTISVDGKAQWRIIFGYTIGIYGLLALIILAPVAIVILYEVLPKRRKRREKE